MNGPNVNPMNGGCRRERCEHVGVNMCERRRYLEQLVADLDAGVTREAVDADRRHEDATAASRLNLDAERLRALLHLDVTCLAHTRPEQGAGGGVRQRGDRGLSRGRGETQG